MTRSQFAIGSATFTAVIFAGFLSAIWADRHYAAGGAQALSESSAACVAADGSWKNWVWANVPALSPKCPPDH